MRRHRWGVAAGLLLLLSLLAGLAGTAWQARVAHAFPDLPHTEGEVRLTLARSYASLGRYDEARKHAQAARDRLEKYVGAEAHDVLRARALLAELGVEQGRYAEARSEIQQVVARQDATLGPAHLETLARRPEPTGEWPPGPPPIPASSRKPRSSC